MWKPPQRIKFHPAHGAVPSREAAAASVLFSPVSIGPLRLKQRTWVPAMVPWRASEDGLVTPDVLQWYERFARGRPGAIVVEATGIRDVPSGPLLRIGHDRYVDGLRDGGRIRGKSLYIERHFILLFKTDEFLLLPFGDFRDLDIG